MEKWETEKENTITRCWMRKKEQAIDKRQEKQAQFIRGHGFSAC